MKNYYLIFKKLMIPIQCLMMDADGIPNIIISKEQLKEKVIQFIVELTQKLNKNKFFQMKMKQLKEKPVVIFPISNSQMTINI